ncbi:AbrB/MazE/SpoVT family DNA-binding domain-containing protein [Alicyclobacillus tolerans]|uniref:AbrB/MazE/SpoVT family DNA-binding domain-containing protein n=1 Tax=Alicyclobacillus tolerans TaxID=90970 RepID=UPI001F408200|nr:AbrB/MazE/SpoVT family DNA-binding domain-containing protein [Alicyclobacillus tolerans]MCF8568474.1 AbrB/MazE/SpoVT family DNA-binding domain-containing protein [Alicyclobacillus tolerans]
MATDTYTIQIRQRGVVTLPNALREAYGLGEDDVLTLVDLGGTFVLSPRVPMISKLARSIEKKREQSGVSVEELLDDLYQDRHSKE